MPRRPKLLGRGGFGRVEPFTLPDGRVVARKFLDPKSSVLELTDIDRLRERFRREVLVQAQMPPGVAVPILAHNLEAETPWFDMPLAEKTFEDQIQQDKSLAMVLPALVAVLASLEYLHSRGLSHRDLRPSNILKVGEWWLLSDFGLVSPGEGNNKLTNSFSAWGCPDYVAPEQWNNFRHARQPADIYSFGCILHDIFGEGRRQIMVRHGAQGPMGPVIMKCTEPKIGKRFPTVAALRQALFLAVTLMTNPVSRSNSDDWLTALRDESWRTWDNGKLAEFVLFLEGLDQDEIPSSGPIPYFNEISSELLDQLMTKLGEDSEAILESYVAWIYRTGFNFDQCDVLADRLKTIYRGSNSMALKAKAVIAAAEVGAYHNRWHVMRVLMGMTSPSVDEDLATMIAMEVTIQKAQAKFKTCAETIGYSESHFHPKIQAAL